jgi:hypothetical protein
MSRFIYILSEGVHDVAFLSRLLKHVHGASKVDQKSKLDEPRQRWINGFKWPVGENIDRLAVPAPKFVYIGASDTLIGLRNAEGIDRLKSTLEDDLEVLYKREALPDTIGVFLDSDKEAQQQRFNKLRAELQTISMASGSLQTADKLATMGTGSPRLGIFAFPSPGTEGALEDLLLELGKVPYEELCKSANDYVNTWHARVSTDTHKEWKDLKGQSGIKKATFATATAVLKPGRGAVATIEDNRWVGHETKDHPALAPCLAFLNELLTPTAKPVASAVATPGNAP